jgi:hypothetical protein
MAALTLNSHSVGVVTTVNSLELIGAVGARILADELEKSLSNSQAGIARYLLDRLQKDQAIAIIHAVLNDRDLSAKVFLREWLQESAMPRISETANRRMVNRRSW